MEFRSATAAATLAIGALTVGAGVSHADPAPTQPNIAYSTKLVDQTVVTTLRHGTFELSKAAEEEVAAGRDGRLTERDGILIDADGNAVDNDVVDVVDVKDNAGRIVLTLPLDFRIAGTKIPVMPVTKKDNTVLELVAQKPAGSTVDQPLVVKPIASQVENQRATNEFTTQFGLATGIGSFVGTAVGAAIGCVITIAAGCVTGAITGASIGGILGTIAVGGPTLIAAGVDLLNTMQAADGTTRWADKPSKPQPGQTAASTQSVVPEPTQSADPPK